MRTALLTLVAFLQAPPLAAQDIETLCPSGVIRWSAAGRMIEGRLYPGTMAGDSLRVTSDKRSVRLETISRTVPGLACRVQESARGRGAGYGLLIGLASGVGLGLASGDDTCSPGGWCILQFSAGTKALMAAAVLAPAGALVGGLSAHGAEWQPITAPPPKTSPPLSLLFDGQRLGVRVRF
jgi:hypothetical protein